MADGKFLIDDESEKSLTLTFVIPHFARLQRSAGRTRNSAIWSRGWRRAPARRLGFPISETPCFLPRSLMTTLGATGLTLINQILDTPAAMAAADAAVPERYRPSTSLGRWHGAEATPTFAQVDFGLVRDADGSIKPKLVELQAFASLYGFQLAIAEAYRDAFGLPSSLDLYLDDLTPDRYHSLVAEAIVGDHDPAEVVLMEIQPRQQKTWPDFVVTEQMWGVRAVDTAEVTREGRRLYLPARWQGHADQAHLQPRHSRRARTEAHPAVVRIRRRPRGAVGRASGVVFPPEQVLDSLAHAPVGSGNAFPRRHRAAADRSRALSAQAAVLIRGRRHRVRAHRRADCRHPACGAQELHPAGADRLRAGDRHAGRSHPGRDSDHVCPRPFDFAQGRRRAASSGVAAAAHGPRQDDGRRSQQGLALGRRVGRISSSREAEH